MAPRAIAFSTDEDELRSWLRERCLEAGISAADLAAQVGGVSEKTVQRWRGEATPPSLPRADEFVRILDVFGLKVETVPRAKVGLVGEVRALRAEVERLARAQEQAGLQERVLHAREEVDALRRTSRRRAPQGDPKATPESRRRGSAGAA